MGNPITWFEILGSDPEKTASFYSELFGWHTESAEGGYILIDTHSGRGMNGGIGDVPPGGGPGTPFYAQDPDIQAVLDKANKLGDTTRLPDNEMEMVTFAVVAVRWGIGGKIVMPAMRVDEHTEIGMFVDPQGNGFGVYSSSE